MSTADTMSLVARGVGGLVIVIVLILISARIARRSRHFGGGTDLEIVHRLGVSRDTQLAVVRVAGRHLLIGIGLQGVSLLSHLDDATMAFEPGAPVSLADLPLDDDAPAPVVVPEAAPVPPVSAAPVTVADLPEDVAAELVAQFEAYRDRQEQAQEQVGEQVGDGAHVAQPVAQPVVWPSFDQPAATAAPVVPAAPDVPVAEEQPRRRRRRHAAPLSEEALAAEARAAQAAQAAQAVSAPVSAAPEQPGSQLLGSINVGDYPDLATALRAAGRTTRTGDQPGSASWIPAPRAGSDDTDLTHATSSAPVPAVPAAQATPPEAAEPAGKKKRGRARRVPQQRAEQASGSVLAPSTWRQGIDALREMTVRRG